MIHAARLLTLAYQQEGSGEAFREAWARHGAVLDGKTARAVPGTVLRAKGGGIDSIAAKCGTAKARSGIAPGRPGPEPGRPTWATS